ncbi:4'-phosphopantetheinyl transferase family protein [Kitasatospora sp. NPDC059646]|uniref:4'-phosphopantetheinyl transferase family protein n=1 Tax=Kitasatospora sp. NPDC059646 TaxID=3346893 RepID=UPI0036B9E83D
MIEIWLTDTDTVAEQDSELQELIDPDERARADRIPDGPRRHRYLTAHAATRRLTAAAAGVPPERVRWRRGPHRRPEPAGLEGELSVDLSAAGRWALFAVQRLGTGGEGQVGVDLEPVPADRAAARVARRSCPASETDGGADEFTRRWTRKEACTKAYGGRLADGLRTPVGAPGGPGPHRVDGPLGPCTLHDLPAPPGHRAAVARTGVRPIRPTLLSCPADPARQFGVHRTPAAPGPDHRGRP